MRNFRDRNPLTIGLVSVAVIVLGLVLAFNAQNLPLIGAGDTYRAEFSEAAGLKPDDEVRIAGVKVGKVDAVELDGAKVMVTFRVKDAWVGDRTTAAIKIKTVLGTKFLALDPRGNAPLDEDTPIPLARTMSPYDVVEAFSGLTQTVGQIDTEQLSQSFEVLATTFKDTPNELGPALSGLQKLSQTIASRNDALQQLLAEAKVVTGVLADRRDQFVTLIEDGKALLDELAKRRDLIHQVLVNTRALALQLSGLVVDNDAQIQPLLDKLNGVADILEANRLNLVRIIQLEAPFVRVFASALGNGRWFDSYVQNFVVPVPQVTP